MTKIKYLILMVFWAFQGQVMANEIYAELDLSTGHNNNVYFNAEDSLNQASAGAPQAEMQHQLSFMLAYEFWQNKDADAKLMFDYYREKLTESDVLTQVLSASVPLSYYQGDYRYRASIAYVNYQLSGINVLDYASLLVDVSKKMNGYKLGVEYSLNDKKAKTADYESYEGLSHTLKTHVSFSNSKYKTALKAAVFDYQYDDATKQYDGYYVQANYKKRFKSASTELKLKYKNSQYLYDSLYAISRQDRQVSLNVIQTLYITANSQFYFDSQYLKNNSNLDFEDENYNYSQWLNTVGVRYIF